MSLSGDAELQTLFRQEMEERVQRLVAGAREIAGGKVSPDVAGAMFREGHTIKGTARVMGFEAVSDAGELLESLWRDLQQGDLEAGAELAEALEAVAAAVLGAIDADPQRGSDELVEAVAHLERLVSGSPDTAAGSSSTEAQAPLAEQPTVVADVDESAVDSPEPAEELTDGTPLIDLEGEAEAVADEAVSLLPSGDEAVVPDPSDPDVRVELVPTASELGGLLSALETWASEESARVNAASLYRLINTVAAVGVESEGLRERLDDLADSVGEAPELQNEIRKLSSSLVSLETSVLTAKQQALTLAAAELAEVTNTLSQLVRYLAKKTDKEIRFELVGDEESVDRQVLERIADPLRHLIVNAIEHGIESAEERRQASKAPTATVAVRAQVKDHRLEVVVEDDGRGVDWDTVSRTAVRQGLLREGEEPDEEALRALLFAPGFSASAQPSELVGDGSGLTSVAGAIEALHGSLRFETEPGKGTRITIAVPTSRALQDAILVRAAGQEWGIPETAVIDLLQLDEAEIETDSDRSTLKWRGQRIPVTSFAEAVGMIPDDEADHVVVLASPVGPVALTVPSIIGQRQVAAKELGPLLGAAPQLTGAALLGGGDVVVLVDPTRLAERARDLPPSSGPRPKVLVVDDSQGVRQVVAAALSSSGFETSVAGSAGEALEFLSTHPVDAVVVDYSMPDADGVSLVEEMRRQHQDLPVVMLSGVATEEDQARALEAGVDSYFDKTDFREGALAASLRSLVSDRAPEGAS